MLNRPICIYSTICNRTHAKLSEMSMLLKGSTDLVDLVVLLEVDVETSSHWDPSVGVVELE